MQAKGKEGQVLPHNRHGPTARLVMCGHLIRQNIEPKSNGAGGNIRLPTQNMLQDPVCPGRLGALRLPRHSHPAVPRCLDSFAHVEKPHSGRADSISHLARHWKEGLGSWGRGPGTKHAFTHSSATLYQVWC